MSAARSYEVLAARAEVSAALVALREAEERFAPFAELAKHGAPCSEGDGAEVREAELLHAARGALRLAERRLQKAESAADREEKEAAMLDNACDLKAGC